MSDLVWFEIVSCLKGSEKAKCCKVCLIIIKVVGFYHILNKSFDPYFKHLFNVRFIVSYFKAIFAFSFTFMIWSKYGYHIFTCGCGIVCT